MSDLLATLRAAHDAREMVKVEVPEYPGLGPFYFRALTLHDQSEIQKGVKKGDEAGLMVNWLMRAALDAEGRRIFDVPLKDRAPLKAELHRVEARVMQRLSMEADGRISQSGAAECVAIGAAPDTLRTVLADFFTEEDSPILAEAVTGADGTVIAKALSDIVSAFEAGKTTKNA